MNEPSNPARAFTAVVFVVNVVGAYKSFEQDLALSDIQAVSTATGGYSDTGPSLVFDVRSLAPQPPGKLLKRPTDTSQKG